MVYIQYYNSIQNIFTALKSSCSAYSSASHHLLRKKKTLIFFFFCLQSFTFSMMSYSWNCIVCGLLRLTSFTSWCAFKVPPSLFTTWWFSSFQCQIIFHSLDISQSIYPTEGHPLCFQVLAIINRAAFPGTGREGI